MKGHLDHVLVVYFLWFYFHGKYIIKANHMRIAFTLSIHYSSWINTFEVIVHVDKVSLESLKLAKVKGSQSRMLPS
jgi:hypothetical protein